MKFNKYLVRLIFRIVDNSGGLEDPDRKQNFDKVYKNIKNFTDKALNRPLAKRWIAQNI